MFFLLLFFSDLAGNMVCVVQIRAQKHVDRATTGTRRMQQFVHDIGVIGVCALRAQ
jgi:hypothetical protein